MNTDNQPAGSARWAISFVSLIMPRPVMHDPGPFAACNDWWKSDAIFTL
jgi:hypothetical protein